MSRLYNGVVKYTGTTVNEQSFVVPSANPDVLPDTPSGVSGGSKLTKITDGAVSFEGTGDYLTLADSTDFTFGTNDFTVECFITKALPVMGLLTLYQDCWWTSKTIYIQLAIETDNDYHSWQLLVMDLKQLDMAEHRLMIQNQENGIILHLLE